MTKFGSETGELLPCPFCKSLNLLDRDIGDEEGGYYEIGCASCNGSKDRFVGVHARSRRDAIEAWNTRAQPQTGKAVRDALDNSQSLFAMIYQLNTNGSVSERDWETEGLSDLITKQITENRSALARPTPSETECDQENK